MSDERAFRGVWIPADIWLNRDLSMQEKVMLVEIDSLQSPTRGCYKSNKKLAEFFQLSPNRVSEIISSLAKKGWVRIEQVRNGKQIVERRIFMATPSDKPNGGIRDPEGVYSENGENPVRDSEEGYSENREERGSGVRGSYEGNPSLSDAGDASESDSIFERAKQFEDSGKPLTAGADQIPMSLDWAPDQQTLAVECQRRGLPMDTQHTAAELADFTAHFADTGKRFGAHAWVARFARWIHENRRREAARDQNTASTTAQTGGNHANRQQRPRQYRSAQEARAAAQRAAGEQPAGSGQTLDGEWSPGER